MRQALIGGALAALIVGAWVVLHVYSVFFHPLTSHGLAFAPLLIVLICWLNVGLFIVAHDAMHGSLFPGAPLLNLISGRVALALYAAFRFDRLKHSHMGHHRAPGSSSDPDFDAAHPAHFWPWYTEFMRRYFGATEFLILCGAVAVYLLIGAHIANVLLFWAVPAVLSSLQLFYFGTFLPHRHEEKPFADEHNARTNEFGWLLSLLTCFHFGYHHQHHLEPGVPWWGLPRARAARTRLRGDPPLA